MMPFRLRVRSWRNNWFSMLGMVGILMELGGERLIARAERSLREDWLPVARWLDDQESATARRGAPPRKGGTVD